MIMGTKDTFDWKMHNGRQYYCRIGVVGEINSVLGVVADTAKVEGEISFVACVGSDWNTFHEFGDDIVAAKNYVMAITALGDEA